MAVQFLVQGPLSALETWSGPDLIWKDWYSHAEDIWLVRGPGVCVCCLTLVFAVFDHFSAFFHQVLLSWAEIVPRYAL